MTVVDIHITQELIDKGVKGNPMLCPVGLAVQPFWGKYSKLRWAGGAIMPPPEVVDFVKRFDAGLPVAPFTTQIEVTA